MSKKRQVLTMVSIAVIAFLIGTLFNMNLMVVGKDEDDDGSPWEKVWKGISELQAKVDSLNVSLIEVRSQVPEKPEVVTTYEWIWENIASAEWMDLISMSDVAVLEGRKVLAIASLYASGKQVGTDFYLRFRANKTFSEELRQNWFDDHTDELIEIHHAWNSLTEGNYTFALQMRNSGLVGVYSGRITLVIF